MEIKNWILKLVTAATTTATKNILDAIVNRQRGLTFQTCSAQTLLLEL